MSEALAEVLADAWDRLERGLRDPGAPARFLTLATVGRTGGAEARMLVLRAVDRAAGQVALHTDRATEKVAEISDNPGVTLLMWDPEPQLQVRLRGRVEIRAGTDAEWAAIPEPRRVAYGGTPPPGTTLEDPDTHGSVPDIERFAVLVVHVDEIETLRLGTPHHRAVFRRRDGFRGAWIAP